MGDLSFALAQAFSGISFASMLLLAALGLALSFGLMRVINMAHGDLLMVGGYLSYMAQQAVPGAAFLPVAMAFAFLGTAAIGALMEVGVIRRLAGRPLDTLLATWGISLVLQQMARNLFGPTGVEVLAPAWLSGSVRFTEGAVAGLSLSYVRLFILGLAIAVLAALWVLFSKTRTGMVIRACYQDREMAQALGVNAGLVNTMVFALGSGIAGVAGSALAFLSPVTPTVGLSYIVDAFLVVILGGLGSLVGTALAALFVGCFSAFAETFTSVSSARVLLLLVAVALLQFRPQGFVALRSRLQEEA